MKILIIDEEFPYPLNSGKRIRTSNLVLALTKYHDLSYLAYGEEGSEAFEFFQKNGLTPYAVRPPNRKQEGLGFYFQLLLNLLSAYPYIVTSHYTRRFERRLIELVKENSYDLVICEWTPYSIFLRDVKATKKIIVAHNIESSIWNRYEQNERNPFKRMYISIQRGKVERFERTCFVCSDGATAVSREEAEIIMSYGVPFEVAVIENGVDIDYFTPQSSKEDPNLLVFTGSMDWRPNQDACLYFAREILPLIKEQKSDAKVVFVGREPPQHIRQLERIDGVKVTGTVEDVRPYIAEAVVNIVPLRIGGGSRLKILEAMAMRKAVVSTSVGAEGLEVTNNENIIISDGAENFARSVVNCMDNNELRCRTSVCGQKLVYSRYRWEDLGEKLNSYIKSIVSTR